MATTRVSGTYGRFTVAGAIVADAENINVKIDPRFIEHRALGEFWDSTNPDGASFELTCSKFCRAATGASFLRMAFDGVNAESPLTVQVYDTYGGIEVFTGQVWAGPAAFSAPIGQPMKEDITFKGTGAPSAVAAII